MANYRIEGNRLINEEEEAQGVGCLLLIGAGALYMLWQVLVAVVMAIVHAIVAFFVWLLMTVKWFLIGGVAVGLTALVAVAIVSQIWHWVTAWRESTIQQPFRWTLGPLDYEACLLSAGIVALVAGVGSGIFAGQMEDSWKNYAAPPAKVAPNKKNSQRGQSDRTARPTDFVNRP